MKLEEFLFKNKPGLSEEVISLCKDGIELMRQGRDPNHNETHVFRILNDLDNFLKQEPQGGTNDVNFEVLLLAICWHDSWRSQKAPKNLFAMFFCLLWDGWGSMLMFRKRARGNGLSKELVDQVSYAIRKHAHYQVLPLKAWEAKILKDLDNLEIWSLERLEILKKIYLKQGKIEQKLVRLARFYFDHFMAKTNKSAFYFDWSKNEFLERRKVYKEEVSKLSVRYGNR